MWSGKGQCTAVCSYEHDNAPSCSIKDNFFFLGSWAPSHYVIYRVFQEKFALLRKNVRYVNSHRYNQTYLYPKLNGYRDARKNEVFLRSQVTWCVIRTLRRSGLEPADKPSHTEACVLCTALESVRTILIQLVGVLLLNYSCYIIYVTQILITC